MNYITELNLFYHYCISKKLSKSEIALLHALYMINNAVNWAVWFDADNMIIQRLTGGLSRESIFVARKKLKQLGRIDFKEGKRNSESASFKIIPFADSKPLHLAAYKPDSSPLPEINLPVDKQLDKQLDKHVGKELGKQLGEHVGEQLGKQLGEHVGKQLGKHVGEHVGEQLGIHVDKHVDPILYKLNETKLNETKLKKNTAAPAALFSTSEGDDNHGRKYQQNPGDNPARERGLLGFTKL